MGRIFGRIASSRTQAEELGQWVGCLREGNGAQVRRDDGGQGMVRARSGPPRVLRDPRSGGGVRSFTGTHTIVRCGRVAKGAPSTPAFAAAVSARPPPSEAAAVVHATSTSTIAK